MDVAGSQDRARCFIVENVEAERLTRRLAELTGESLTTAVTVAVRERLERVEELVPVDIEDRAARILALGQGIATRLAGPLAERNHGDLLYDDRGLPT